MKVTDRPVYRAGVPDAFSMLIAELEAFTDSHRPHGQLFADVGAPGPNGYRLEVRCHCGAVFERWVTPTDAGVELALFARWN